MGNLRLAAVTLIGALLASGSVGAPDDRPLQWYRCNTHSHTSARPNSDANGSPDLAVSWYKAHGYHCLVITDHEYLTDIKPFNRKYGEDGAFLVIRGQEITQRVRDSSQPFGFRAAHVNGISIDRPIMPMGVPQNPDGTPLPDAYRKPMGVATMPEGTPLAETYLRNIAMIRDAGGIAQVNHPNLHWSVTLDDLLSIDGTFLLEVWNAFPSSNNLGGTDNTADVRPSTEALWDALLRQFGVSLRTTRTSTSHWTTVKRRHLARAGAALRAHGRKIMQGALALGSLVFMRPVPGYADYRTPVRNLYLCGAATHPGGGVMGACGYNAAREILRDMRR